MDSIKSMLLLYLIRIVSLYYNRFVKELNDELESNLDEIKEFIKTKEFVQLLEPYFYDLD